jgi:nucleoside-diphosphate-sugar epimerase
LKPLHSIVIGLGYVGYRIAQEELSEGNIVYGLTRSPETFSRAELSGITAITGDLDHVELLPALPLQNAIVYYLAPPPRQGHCDTRMTNFLAAAAAPPAALVYTVRGHNLRFWPVDLL